MKQRVKKFEIDYVPESLNCDAHYQVTGDGRDLATFQTPEKARDFVKDWKNTIIIRTKRIDSYFEGIIRRDHFPFDGDKYHIACVSYAGGKPPILDVLDFKADTESKLLTMINVFRRKHHLILERK